MRKEFEELIDYVQSNFGNDLGMPSDLPQEHPGIPRWLEPKDKEIMSIEKGEYFIIEGKVSGSLNNIIIGKGTSVEEHFAYYKPFHFYKNDWGVYIRALGVHHLASIISTPTSVTPESVSLAFNLLVEHERFHFITEIAVSKFEKELGRPIYAWCGYTFNPRLRRCNGGYIYHAQASLHEESLANAFAYNNLKKHYPKRLLKLVYVWMRNQAPGYSSFYKRVGKKFIMGLVKAKRYFLEVYEKSKFLLWPDGLAILTIVETGGIVTWDKKRDAILKKTRSKDKWPFIIDKKIDPPVYLMPDKLAQSIRIVKPFPKKFGIQVFVHTNDHKPPHIHIRLLNKNIETRYEWPNLRPLAGDDCLSSSELGLLQKYLILYRKEINEKVCKISWR